MALDEDTRERYRLQSRINDLTGQIKEKRNWIRELRTRLFFGSLGIARIDLDRTRKLLDRAKRKLLELVVIRWNKKQELIDHEEGG